MKPLTTLVRTNRSCGHRDITFRCKQLQMYRKVLQIGRRAIISSLSLIKLANVKGHTWDTLPPTLEWIH